MVWHRLYRRLVEPRSRNEDIRRRELILNILLAGIVFLAGITLLVALINSAIQGGSYGGVAPWTILGIICIFGALYGLSRIGWSYLAAYIFILLLVALATWPLVVWGIQLPQGVLMYGLVIVMSGVLINSRSAFYLVLLLLVILLIITYAQGTDLITHSSSWKEKPGSYSDVIVYSFSFMLIALVAWLSNREIERSLRRARASEKALLKERGQLEIKVRQRTEELEKAQVEKMMDLQRFAEFGRLSSTLLHELANPLTAVSMNLEQLENKHRSEVLAHAREGIASMEQYVQTARRQLRSQSEIRQFNLADEILRVGRFLQPKATAQRVEVEFNLIDDIELKGDSVRFDHIISNLLSNAIDAYDGITDTTVRKVGITMRTKEDIVEIIVCDRGQGIGKEQLKHLFEPFYTTKQVNRGTGLGLAIVKHAVEEAFDGEISASYTKQKGTCFTVCLPLG